jgi:hypothetical protein
LEDDILDTSTYDPTWEAMMCSAGDENNVPKKGRMVGDVPRKEAIERQKSIAYNYVLEDLLRVAVGDICQKCGREVAFHSVQKASCLVISYECTKSKAHVNGSWCSQPRTGGMYSANLLVPIALILSGNNYRKLALFSKFLGLGFVGESNTYRCV